MRSQVMLLHQADQNTQDFQQYLASEEAFLHDIMHQVV